MAGFTTRRRLSVERRAEVRLDAEDLTNLDVQEKSELEIVVGKVVAGAKCKRAGGCALVGMCSVGQTEEINDGFLNVEPSEIVGNAGMLCNVPDCGDPNAPRQAAEELVRLAEPAQIQAT